MYVIEVCTLVNMAVIHHNMDIKELVVSIEEVMHAIEKLDLNKACGSEGICSEHKYVYFTFTSYRPMCVSLASFHMDFSFCTSQCCQ